jgi:rhomboid protease GluP
LLFVRHESFRQFLRLYPVVSWLIGINTFLFALSILIPPLYSLIQFYGIGWNSRVMAGEWWRLFTPIFLHGGLGHFIFNSFALIIFGPALERMFGRWKFLFVYLFAGVAGNVGTLLFALRDTTHLGASGAIYGLFGIYLYMTIFRKDLIDRGSAQIVLVVLALGALFTLVPGSSLFGGGRINVLGHLFGFIGGALLAPVLFQGKIQPYHTYFYIPGQADVQQDQEIKFDPNRWQKRRFRRFRSKQVIWIILLVLIAIGLLSRLL